MDKYFKDMGFQGPVEEANHTRYWYRKVPNTNHHQIVVREWDMGMLGLGVSFERSYEVEMTYETEFEIWATTKFYGLNEEDLKANLYILSCKLQDSITTMGGDPDHYRYDGED